MTAFPKFPNGHKPLDFVVGIDPDTDKSGYALIDVRKGNIVALEAYSFPVLLSALHSIKLTAERTEKSYRVIIEAGWLNPNNWHLLRADNKAQAAAKGNAVGRNHEVGRKIAEMCKYWSMPHECVKPLRKMWRGNDRKITAAELKRITGWTARTNQETRDAALLAWVWAGLPL